MLTELKRQLLDLEICLPQQIAQELVPADLIYETYRNTKPGVVADDCVPVGDRHGQSQSECDCSTCVSF